MVNEKYLIGYIEDRIELLKQTHREMLDTKDSGAIQMLARIEELQYALREVVKLSYLEWE